MFIRSIFILLIAFFTCSTSVFSADKFINVQYKPASKAGDATCAAKFPATSQYTTGFRHMLTPDCYSCPAGYNRSIKGISAADACKKRTPASTVHNKATYRGKRNVSKPGPKYRGKVFYDPRKGGEWWECPKNYTRRTVHAVTHKKACAGGRNRTSAKYRGKKVRSKPAGSFYDPRAGGEYWSCPAGYNRTATAVTSANACKKVTAASTAIAKVTKRGVRGCPNGAFRNGARAGCYTCPRSYKRSIAIGNDLTKLPKACVNVQVNRRAIIKNKFINTAKDRFTGLRNKYKPYIDLVKNRSNELIDKISKFKDAETKEEKKAAAKQLAHVFIRLCAGPATYALGVETSIQTMTVGLGGDASYVLGGSYSSMYAYPILGNIPDSVPRYNAASGALGASLSASGFVEFGLWVDSPTDLAGYALGATGGAEMVEGIGITFWWFKNPDIMNPNPKFLGFTIAIKTGGGVDVEGAFAKTWAAKY